jgi:H+/Cl- antiporter ClcA
MDDAFQALKNVPTIVLYFGFVTQALPFVIATANRQAWSSFVKWCTTIVACFVAAAGYFVIDAIFGSDPHQWDTREWATFAMWVCAGTAIFYKLYKPAVKEVEGKTG